jgi:hypothetical protein
MIFPKGSFMSIENVQRFYETLAKDSHLREKISILQEKYGKKRTESTEGDENSALNDIVLLAGETGFDFTPEELRDYSQKLKSESSNQLTEEELDAVSGAGSCYCWVGGGGREDGTTICACALFGLGADEKCVCVGVGYANW